MVGEVRNFFVGRVFGTDFLVLIWEINVVVVVT